MKENYTVEMKTSKRMKGGALEGCEMYEVEETHYHIFRDGKLVGITFDAEDINLAIERMEKYPHAGRTMNNRFD